MLLPAEPVVFCIDGSTKCFFDICKDPFINNNSWTLRHSLQVFVHTLVEQLFDFLFKVLRNEHFDHFDCWSFCGIHNRVRLNPLNKLFDSLNEHRTSRKFQKIAFPHVYELQAELTEESVNELQHLFLNEVDFLKIFVKILRMQFLSGILRPIMLVFLFPLFVLQIVNEILGLLDDNFE